MRWTCKKSELILDTKYFKVRKDVVTLPNGDEKEWTYWDTQDSAMVVGMTKDKQLVMIRQYRYLVGDEVIEFPSGYSQDGETMEAAAQREFLEETGYAAKNLVKLGAFYETYGQLNRKIHLYFSDEVTFQGRTIDPSDEVVEDIKVELVEFGLALQYALENRIVAMGSALAILLVKEKLAAGGING